MMSRSERAQMVARHLHRVDPTLDGSALASAVDAAFGSYARYWAESFRLPHLPSDEVAAKMTVDGLEHIEAAHERGKGTILALPHLGGWEWAGRWLIELGYPMTVVVERINPPKLFDWFVDLRQSLGMTVVPLGTGAGKRVLGALRNNEVVCLLCDRDIAGDGVETEFFGETTTLPAGPVTLGLRTGAAVLPTAVYFTDEVDGHHGVVRPPLALQRTDRRLAEDRHDGLALLAGELEYLIRQAPEQWHLFQPNWPSDPGYRR